MFSAKEEAVVRCDANAHFTVNGRDYLVTVNIVLIILTDGWTQINCGDAYRIL